MKDTETFLKVLDPEDSSTGGGSAAAISGAMAGALVAMVCRLCAKAPETEDDEAFRRSALEGRQLSERLLAGSREDALAFQAVRSAFKLAKGSEEERKKRSQAIQSAWIEAARIPLENAARCWQALQLGSQLSGRVLPQVRSDLNCAILLARAGLLGCLENVDINLPSIQDQTIVSELGEQANRLRAALASLERTMDERSTPPSSGK